MGDYRTDFVHFISVESRLARLQRRTIDSIDDSTFHWPVDLTPSSNDRLDRFRGLPDTKHISGDDCFVLQQDSTSSKDWTVKERDTSIHWPFTLATKFAGLKPPWLLCLGHSPGKGLSWQDSRCHREENASWMGGSGQWHRHKCHQSMVMSIARLCACC